MPNTGFAAPFSLYLHDHQKMHENTYTLFNDAMLITELRK